MSLWKVFCSCCLLLLLASLLCLLLCNAHSSFTRYVLYHALCVVHNTLLFFSIAEAEVDAFLKSIDNAVAKDDKANRKLAHSVITGPTGSGKSSLILRLLQRPLEKFSKSTGVIDAMVVVDIAEINPTTFHSATAIGSDLWQETHYDVSLVNQMGQRSTTVPAITQPPAESKSSFLSFSRS